MNNIENNFIDKAQGALVGLALGDALGTTLEFKPKDSYQPITDIVGGGPFQLEAGHWTDDTSMALCLADSLLAYGKNNPKDQMSRYLRWFEEGYNSVTGRCFDIGNTVSDALDKFKVSQESLSGSDDPLSAGNGSLMRLAPIPIFFSSHKDISVEECMHFAELSSITTHAEPRAIQACRIMSWLMYQIFEDHSITKEELFSNLEKAFDDLHPEMFEIVKGSFLAKQRSQIYGKGFVVKSLEAALWCFANSDSFKDGALMAANLGEDADTTAAIYGQLAGAYYGYSNLPEDWLSKLSWHSRIVETASFLATVPLANRLLESLIESEPLSTKLIYERQLVLSGYNWKNFEYMNVFTSNDEKKVTALIQELSFVECLQALTVVVRKDRFCEGTFRQQVEQGTVFALLNRIQSLGNAGQKGNSDFY